ncbi:hypothetical protein [Paenibacillus polymyxa]|uniref:Uncharacterized protein n=1 Tax=Paenibacillus polymyxa (strain SC2) TaxID=886882 RepID=E3ELC9_PAEPS|nr:hypothetical protein [Paenibacillus polymyxa]ADO59961.1 hypothetical protein PPSC2_28370 [Paenibacillus polymyxa SC2]WPQ59819.1 hypothetical protein SKN87_26380 [Paenibacillus polymyxa]
MENSFTIKTQEEFEALKADEKAIKVNFDYQFERVYEDGQIIFFATSDGFGAVYKKKSFGLSKPKAEIYILDYAIGVPERLRNNYSTKSAKKIFNDFHKDGVDFFYIEGLH